MLLIDGNNMMHRVLDGVVRGIHPVRALYNRFAATTPEPVIIVWDGPYGNQERRKDYPDYKANRRPKEESKLELFDTAKGVLSFTPTVQVEVPGWEADDVIATIIHRLHGKYSLTLESNDGDYWQHSEYCKLPLVPDKWRSFKPLHSVLFKAMVGDTKDNVPGISGFGAKSWDRLVNEEKDLLIKSIREDNFSLFEEVGFMSFPKRLKPTPELFEKLKLYWKVKHWMEVPEKIIDEHTRIGKGNAAAAEIFLGNFMI